MKPPFTHLLFTLLLAVLGESVVQAQPAVGVFTGSQDIGAGVKAGAATYRPATQQYVLSGAGQNIWGNHDEFR